MTSLTVWHDGGRPLCAREVALMRRLDRRGVIAFVDASDPAGHCPEDRSALLARFHAREDGQTRSGAAAFAAMWRAIPLLRPLGLAARNPHHQMPPSAGTFPPPGKVTVFIAVSQR